jgi:hypothetical protein
VVIDPSAPYASGIRATLPKAVIHRSVVINLDGDSYRLRDHHARNQELRRITTGTRQPLR